MIPKKWEIELKLPKGKIRTFVYSDDGTNIVNRFGPQYECKVIGILKEEDTEEKKIIRDILVCHGETMKKIHGKTVWADLMFKNLNKGETKHFPIIPDVRFDFEAKYIQEKGGQVVHISKIGNLPPNKIEEENDPLCRESANVHHTWGVYAPDKMHHCKDHASILWQMLKEDNEDKWKKIYC